MLKRININVSTDNFIVAKGLSDLGAAIGKKIPLYIDVNTGLNRCGKEPGQETAALVEKIITLPSVEVIGLMTHGGHAYANKTYEEMRETALNEVGALVYTKMLLEEKGILIQEVSVGSTPTSKHVQIQKGATEIRPVAYVYGDSIQLSCNSINHDEIAMSVLATVVSMPRKGTVIIDAGSKTLSSDLNPHRSGYGFWKHNSDVYIERVSEEHCIVNVPEDVTFSVGDRLEFIPNHCCPVTNLHDRLYGIRGEVIEREIIVDTRGRSR